jgi:hypothetical protein
MIAGTHFLLYSKDPEAERALFKTVLEFPSIDLGEVWLLFALPPAELAVHLGEGEFLQLHAEHPMLGAARPRWKPTGESAQVFACRAEARLDSTSRRIPL